MLLPPLYRGLIDIIRVARLVNKLVFKFLIVLPNYIPIALKLSHMALDSCMSDLKRCYEILEIKPESTYEEAKLAFRDMVSIWHPDKFSHNSRLQEKAEEKLKDLNAAWEQLQAFFIQKEDAVADQPCGELAEPVKLHLSQERKQRQQEGKAVRTDCSFVDLEVEPLIHIEQARKAYRHRFHGLHPDLGTPQGVDSDSDGIATESINPQKSAGAGEQHETTGQRGIRRLRYDREKKEVTRRHPDEQESCEIKTEGSKRHDKIDKEPTHGRKAAQHSLDDSFNESDRKIRLLSDSYLMGFLERKFVNWQQREREDRKQQDAAKDIDRKNKKMAELFLTRYKIWLAKEKSKYKTSPKISSLFKISASSVGGIKTGKFLFGVPDITMAFVKGGSFLMGNNAVSNFDKISGRNSELPYSIVTVDDYYIGKYPVTVRQWSKVKGVEVEGGEQDFPVLLNWGGVQEFIFRLNDITGLKFRVPTEAEWEYAARSGGKDDNCSGISDGSAIHGHASPARGKVGQSKPNGLGFFDMLGNSSEWVTGSSPKQLRQNGPQGAAREAGNVGRLVIRGAVPRDLPDNSTKSYTFHRSSPSTDKVLRFGFRLAHAAF
jgi:formylglycine-generating enzyme required for sulfatase activity